METNGTPFTDEDWKMWYGHKSNKERFIEEEEIDREQQEFEQSVEADKRYNN